MEVFSDSVNSGGSCLYFPPPSPSLPADAAADALPPDVEALRRLSANLSSLFLSQSPNFSDVTLAVSGGAHLALHRCLLSARSPFFYNHFAQRATAAGGGGARLELGEILSGYEVGYEALVLVMGYIYSGKVGPLPEGICECADEGCGHLACPPAVDFMLQVLFASFTFEIWELVNLFQRHVLGILYEVDIDDVPTILYVASMCSKACGRLLEECLNRVVFSNLDAVTLEKALPEDIAKQIKNLRTVLGLHGEQGSFYPDIHATRIHKALDSDDIALVKLLLEEGRASLDGAYALHHAVAYCNPNITAQLLELRSADVNRINSQGHTVLHVAAKRKDPEIIMCLLNNGAQPYDLTTNGRTALQISKRLTRAADFKRPVEHCKDSPIGRVCIDMLEQAERRDPQAGEASSSIETAASELLQKLQYLEIRVQMAKLLYPVEARVAMVNAHVDGTLEFTLDNAGHVQTGNQGSLNGIPFVIKEEHMLRMRALSKTVELGMRYFPRCSEVISRWLGSKSTELTEPENNTIEERRKRFLEIQDEIKEAFLEDKKELGKSGMCSSSSKSTGRARSKTAKR